MNIFILGAWVATMLGMSSASDPVGSAGHLNFVTIDSPNNPADTNGCGRVGYVYKISREQVDNKIYAEFLNSVDPNGTNTKSLYNADMMNSPRGGIALASDKEAGSRYQVKPGMANSPVLFVQWADAARFTNWLTNGGQKGSSTEVGTYNLRASKGKMVDRNGGVRYCIPNQDELYKAAFYLPLGASKIKSDQLYAVPGDNGVQAGAIALPVAGGVSNELVDPYDVTNDAKPEWTGDSRGTPTSFAFAGVANPSVENNTVGFHLLMRTDGEYADNGGDEDEYAGAPDMSNTVFTPSFPGGGAGSAPGVASGGRNGRSRIFSPNQPVTVSEPPSS